MTTKIAQTSNKSKKAFEKNLTCRMQSVKKSNELPFVVYAFKLSIKKN